MTASMHNMDSNRTDEPKMNEQFGTRYDALEILKGLGTIAALALVDLVSLPGRAVRETRKETNLETVDLYKGNEDKN